MDGSYFERVKVETPTRLWINNPTAAEIGPALAHGAVGCTTNPSYAGGLLRRAPDEVRRLIATCVGSSDDDRVVADEIQERLVGKLTESFRPLFEASGGREGFVSIQGAPELDTDGMQILGEARLAQTIAPNATPKIPATLPGFYAFEQIVADGGATIVTEVFSLAQLAYACELYGHVVQGKRLRPPFFVSPITGIFGDHLRSVATREGIGCDPAVLDWAGVALARACNDLVEEHAYPVTLLFGGARVLHDFTALVGAKTAATINYSTIEEVLAVNPAVEDTIHQPTDPEVIAELTNKFTDFRKALAPDGLSPSEFESFGPVQHFRGNFLAAHNALLAAIADMRASLLAPEALLHG